MPKKTIEQSANKSFFNRKTITIGILLFTTVVLITVIMAITLKDVDFNIIFKSIRYGFDNELVGLWYTILVLFIIFRFYYYLFPYWIRLRKLGIKINGWEYIGFAIISLFIASITPTSGGSEPYVLWFLKRKGLPTNKASALVFSNSFFVQFASAILFIPSLIAVAILMANNNGSADVLPIIFITIGTVGLIFNVLFYLALGWFKHVHYFLSRCWNETKRFFRLPYHTKEETVKTYLVEGHLRKYFVEYIKDYKDSAFILGFYLFYFISYSLSFCIVLKVLGNEGNEVNFQNFVNHNFGQIFVSTCVTVIANGAIPIPGGEGSMQTMLKFFIVNSVKTDTGDANAIQIITGSSIFCWRFVTFYTPMVLAILPTLIICGIGINFLRKSKKRKQINTKANKNKK